MQTLPAKIVHQPQEQKFLYCHDGDCAYVRYEIEQSQGLIIRSTFVPPAWRGQGIAQKIVEAVREYAHDQIIPLGSTCSYASKILSAA